MRHAVPSTLRRASRAALPTLLLLAAGCGDNGPVPDGSGTFEAVDVRVAAETAGQIVDLRVDEGDRVAAGDTIAVIDPEPLRLQKDEGEAGLREARARALMARRERERAEVALGGVRTKSERVLRLHERRSATDQARDDAENGLRLAEATVASARSAEEAALRGVERAEAAMRGIDYRLSQTAVIAPLSGVVTVRHRRAGELVSPGLSIVTVADLGQVWLEGFLPEPDLPRAKLGGEVKVRVDGMGERAFAGRITWIASEAEFTPTMAQTRDARADLVYALKISVPNEDGALKIGMPGDFYLP